VKSKLENILKDKFINPILHSTDPVSEVSLGVAVGVFFGLTPTVGIQMYLVAAIWTIYRYIFKKHFNLPVGVAMVWISNPLTMIPLYYLFLMTGYWLLETENVLSYMIFTENINRISQTEGTLNMIANGSQFLLIDLGWPMIVGSIIFAVPGFIISYFLTYRIVSSHRKIKARLAGMGYNEWRAKYETKS
tara:strand:- start:1713 stop:2282 length:570 start_codon:yes stop_codon:yes gene_type:complete